jgi:hypothetical protein
VAAGDQGMRAAVGEAISTAPASRLPGLLFGVGVEPGENGGTRASFSWLLVPSPRGYSVAEHRSEEPLRRGDRIELDGLEYRVAVVAPSPFHDGERCGYLERGPGPVGRYGVTT